MWAWKRGGAQGCFIWERQEDERAKEEGRYWCELKRASGIGCEAKLDRRELISAVKSRMR
jgi:hypothetical protein